MAAWKDGTALFVCVLVVVLETAVFRRFAAARAAAAPIGDGNGCCWLPNITRFPKVGMTPMRGSLGFKIGGTKALEAPVNPVCPPLCLVVVVVVILLVPPPPTKPGGNIPGNPGGGTAPPGGLIIPGIRISGLQRGPAPVPPVVVVLV